MFGSKLLRLAPVVALIALAESASASLIGAQVSYQYIYPVPGSIDGTLPTQVVTPLTKFTDTRNGLTSFFLGNQLVVQNTEAAAFVTAPFNGPQFTFSSGGVTGATVAGSTSADFSGTALTTANSVAVNFSALSPALGSTQRVNIASGAPLAGQQVTYQYLVPTTGNVQEDLGTQTLGTGTYFADSFQGITVVVDANTITVLNDVQAGFIPAAFNGPKLLFSGVHIDNATIDPLSAADFTGSLSFTPDSIAFDLSSLFPAKGHALVIDVASSPIPEPATIALFGIALMGAGWAARRRHRGAA